MKVGKRFNTLTKEEYFHFIDNYKKYSDFNTLGLYRSITENEHLDLTDKIEVRDYANETFSKTFIFFQLKDPGVYFNLITLGQELTRGDEFGLWDNIRKNQDKILSEKRIKHRNFGNYSKHNCGYEDCPYNGLMIRQGSYLAENNMHFDSDKSKYSAKSKSKRIKKERKGKHRIIREDLDNSDG